MAAEAEQDEECVQIEEIGSDGEVVETSAAGSAAAAVDGPADEDDIVPLPDDATKSSTDREMEKVEEEKKGMTVVEKLERSLLWKAEGNTCFKKNEIFKAADCYYHAILFCRELTQNPQYYPNIGHTPEQRQTARDLCEGAFNNLALVQCKYGSGLAADHQEREKVLSEAAKSASEALKLNSKNVKALFRRGQAKAALAKGANVKNHEAQVLYGEAKADFLAAIEADGQNREARVELREVQEQLKRLKKEEIATEKKEFSFANSLAAVGTKDKDLLGDGSVKKGQMVKSGDGGNWFNEDWLKPGAASKCVIHLSCGMVSSGGKDIPSGAAVPVTLSFNLGDADMHDGIQTAIKSMTVGEVSRFSFAPNRISAPGPLAKMLPDPKGQASVWEITFIKFAVWEDLRRDGEMLQKIHSEGYGEFPEPLAEVYMHWKLLGPDGHLIHSSRYTLNVAGEGGLKPVEDEDKQPLVYVLGESIWEPLGVLCASLRQGGAGELRMRRVPELPKETGGDPGNPAVAAQISMMLNKKKGGEALDHCVVRAELIRVSQPLHGPEDPRWEGIPAIVQERLRAEALLEKGEEAAALSRFRRVQDWAEQLDPDDVVREQLAAARASIGWVLVSRAAPILDLGSVTSDVLAAARRDAAEAEEHCVWLEERCPESVGTRVLRAKLLVAEDDDFENAHQQLLQAQRLAPDDRRVQEELKNVKVQLRKAEEEQSRVKVIEIRDSLKRARTDGGTDRVVGLLRELAETRVSWDTIMDTRIGVELKCCQEGCGEEAKRLCCEILGRFKDESKEQRPMWAS